MLKLQYLEMNDGSDLSSLGASRHTNPKGGGTPMNTRVTLSQTCNTDLPLLPILEEEHHSEQENTNPNFLPDTHFSTGYIPTENNQETPIKESSWLAINPSTLAIVE